MITITPHNPTSDDSVSFTINSYCPYPEISQTVVGSQFIITATPPDPVPPCVGGAPPLPHTLTVGRIQAGDYQVILNYPGFPQEIQALSVSQGQLSFPLPAIPTFGIPAATLLIVILGGLAIKSLKQSRKLDDSLKR